MSLIDLMDNADVWQEFYLYKQQKGHLNKHDDEELAKIIEQAVYRPIVKRIRDGEHFGYPTKHLINKLGTNKKRVVYCFALQEMWVLKLLAFLLFAYDDHQPRGCYSFRRDYGAHKAIRTIVCTPSINTMWCYKLDISDYFNSIQIPLLLPILADVISDDPQLLGFLTTLLTADRAYINGVLTEEKRGVMAGTPTSPFLANLYLREMDDFFIAQGLPYARYSDDIIVFANSIEEIDCCKAQINELLKAHGLIINKKKEQLVSPGEKWDFLGVSYHSGTIDLSGSTKDKLKGKIRRKSRALHRWMLRKDAEPERAMKALIRVFNRKFYEGGDANDLTWSRWFFPLINSSDGLKEVDAYLQLYIRYVASGHFRHANYRVDYQTLKHMGYRSLVHEYYSSRKM